MKRFDPIISDFSGQNWDDLALNLLIESVATAYHQKSVNEARTLNGSDKTFKNVYVLNAGPSSHEQALEEVRAEEERADLSHSDLHNADLSHANLKGANLTRANLFEARLDHANLENADLRGADLRSARMAAAKLKDARLYGAIFNQWTDLPFDKETAVRKGMIYLEITSEQ